MHKLQKRSLRIINRKSHYHHTEPLFKKSEVLNVYDQYKYSVLTFMYQLKNDKLPSSFDTFSFFIPDQFRPQTRQYKLANCSKFRTTYSSKLPTHAFPRMWNNLDIKLRECPSINIFKKDLRTSFLCVYSYNIRCFNVRCKQCYPR